MACESLDLWASVTGTAATRGWSCHRFYLLRYTHGAKMSSKFWILIAPGGADPEHDEGAVDPLTCLSVLNTNQDSL